MRLGAELALVRGTTHRYGGDAEQHGELYLPAGGGPHPVVVLIHGGSWDKRHGKLVMRALARDLRRRGLAVWNIEYRRLGNGGGWPRTFADIGAAIDHLRELEAPLDLARVGLVGHSAGGHLALWAAGRKRLAPGAPGALAARVLPAEAEPDADAEADSRDRPPAAEGDSRDRPRAAEERGAIRITYAVALAGVCDLARGYGMFRGGAIGALIGGSPEECPERFAVADPVALLPLDVPVLLVHGVKDTAVSIELSRSYARAAAAAGMSVELVELPGRKGDHRSHIDPRSAGWRAAAAWLQAAAHAG